MDKFTWCYVKGAYVITKNKEVNIKLTDMDSVQELIQCLEDIQGGLGFYEEKVKAREL